MRPGKVGLTDNEVETAIDRGVLFARRDPENLDMITREVLIPMRVICEVRLSAFDYEKPVPLISCSNLGIKTAQ